MLVMWELPFQIECGAALESQNITSPFPCSGTGRDLFISSASTIVKSLQVKLEAIVPAPILC